ncbi:MAG TPA: AgmX/PglI C-terminal domain-containing protein [Deltaproteobacteria bacterium]|nr:AgmX/PglI C-terminal domain-containing protein [Deltaproteobacteria bacterium]
MLKPPSPVRAAPKAASGKKSGKKDVIAGIRTEARRKVEEVSEKALAVEKKSDEKAVRDIVSEKRKVALVDRDALFADVEKEADEAVEVKKSRSESDVYRVVRRYTGGLKYLYNNALREDPALRGDLRVKIVIGADGKVKLVEKLSTTLDSERLVKALVRRIYRWKFPRIEGDEDFSIVYTFDFTPEGLS